MNSNDKQRDDLAECLKSFSNGARNGRLRAIFAVGLGLDGPLPVVFVEPEDRESLIIAINEELTRMIGSPHHVVGTVYGARVIKFFFTKKLFKTGIMAEFAKLLPSIKGPVIERF